MGLCHSSAKWIKGISLIDESTGSGDGFAVDFIRILVNRKRENSCRGSVRGKVIEKGTDQPISGANVSTAENIAVKTNSSGQFGIKNIPTGAEILKASASGYTDGTAVADIAQGDENEEMAFG